MVEAVSRLNLPHIELPASVSADGWADDLFAAAGTHPDPAASSRPTSLAIVRRSKPALANIDVIDSKQTELEGGSLDTAGQLSTIGEDDMRPPARMSQSWELKVKHPAESASAPYLSPHDHPSLPSQSALNTTGNAHEVYARGDLLEFGRIAPRTPPSAPSHTWHRKHGSEDFGGGSGAGASLRSSHSKASWKSATGFVGKVRGALKIGKRERAISESARRE